jgi:hypothetical protein
VASCSDVRDSHDQRRRAEHLVAEHFVALEGVGVGREQRADRLVDAVADAAARQQLDALATGQLIHALLDRRRRCRASA